MSYSKHINPDNRCVCVSCGPRASVTEGILWYLFMGLYSGLVLATLHLGWLR